MSDDEHITESILGTKDYWEHFYETELTNYEDYGDCGETWFGAKNTHRIIDWVVQNVEKNASICDIGCGNGYILSKLASKGFSNLVGCDYSQKAIDFCLKMYSNNEATKGIRFEIVDILEDMPSNPSKSFDVILDKGTYDAICLMPNADIQKNRQLYMNFVINHLNENAHFVIMSCNFTKEEMLKCFSHKNGFQCVHEFEVPKISFGGKTGNQVTSIVMKRI